MYRRNLDGKLYQLTKSVDTFMGMINWHDGPYYETNYTLVSIDDDKKELILTTLGLFNQFTIVQQESQSASTISSTN